MYKPKKGVLMKFLAMAVLFALVGCNGGSGSGSNDKRRDEARCLCLPITYLSLTSADTLPKNLEIKINQNTVFNSCGEFPSVAISKQDHLIRFSFSPALAKVLNLEIIDKGDDCRNNAIFFSQEDVPYSRKVTRDDPAQPRLEEVTISI